MTVIYVTMALSVRYATPLAHVTSCVPEYCSVCIPDWVHSARCSSAKTVKSTSFSSLEPNKKVH